MEATLDKITTKIETSISYYSENLDQLYRLVVGLALFSYACSVLMTAWSCAHLDTALFAVPQIYTPLIVGLAYAGFMSLFALIVRKRLRDRHPTSITMFALFLALNLAGLHVFVFMLGLWALFNGKFRESMRSVAPEWYRKLTSSLD